MVKQNISTRSMQVDMCLAGRAGTNQLVGAGVELRVCDGVGGAAPRVSHMHCRQCWRARDLGANVAAPWAHVYECFTKFRNARCDGT